MPRVKIDGWECSRCGHVWVSREDARPRVCPRCKSAFWDVPREPKPQTVRKPKPWERPRPDQSPDGREPSQRTESILLPPDPNTMPPRVSAVPFAGPTLTIEEVCKRAGVPYRYSGGTPHLVAVARGAWHLRSLDPEGRKVLVVDESMLLESRTDAERWLRVLEVLAHSFHEYAARESAKGLFGFPKHPPDRDAD